MYIKTREIEKILQWTQTQSEGLRNGETQPHRDIESR